MIVTEVSQNKSRQLAFIIPENCCQGFDEAVITFVTIADLRHKHTETMLYNGPKMDKMDKMDDFSSGGVFLSTWSIRSIRSIKCGG